MPWSDESAPDGPARDTHTDRRVAQQSRTARTAEATTIGRNGMVVEGGSITVRNGGTISAAYPSGRSAATFGPLIYEDTGLPSGHGLLVQADDDSAGRDIFRAKYENGQRLVYFGQTPGDDASGAVDRFVVDSVAVDIHSHGEDLRIQSHHGGDIRIHGGDNTTQAGDVQIATFQGGLINIQSAGNGDVQVLSDDRLWLFADGNLDGTVNGNITMRADGTAAFGGDGGTFVLPQSGSGTANVRMDTATGQLTYVSSTERVKSDIQDLAVDPGAVLQLRPRTWLPGPTTRQCPDWAHTQHPEGECHAGELIDPPPDAVREVGFVAEELDALGLGDFVEYGVDDGLPMSIRYDRMTAALIPLVQQQQAQITELTERVTALEAAITPGTPEPEEA